MLTASSCSSQDSSVGCEPIVSNLGIDPSLLQQRYSHLLAGGEPSPYVSDPQGFFFALNLFNAKAVIPHLFNTLLSISTLLGPSNVHISIFENGSWDETKDAMAHFARALTALGQSTRLGRPCLACGGHARLTIPAVPSSRRRPHIPH